jgi:hypothetical protein
MVLKQKRSIVFIEAHCLSRPRAGTGPGLGSGRVAPESCQHRPPPRSHHDLSGLGFRGGAVDGWVLAFKPCLSEGSESYRV